MSLLSYTQLEALAASGVLTLADFDQINAASIDLTLGNEVMAESPVPEGTIVSLRDREQLTMERMSIAHGYYDLKPGEAILAHTAEEFHLPADVSGLYVLKSSMARIFLNHLNAGFADAGWHGSVLTLELVNTSRYHTIRLHAGVRIGQMLFFNHAPVPPERSYATRGRYNGDKTVEAIKE